MSLTSLSSEFFFRLAVAISGRALGITLLPHPKNTVSLQRVPPCL